MVYEGHVHNGAVVLDNQVKLPEGAKVRVTVVESPAAEEPIPTLYERLKPFIGKAEGLPPDMAENHDHYLYGVPKKS